MKYIKLFITIILLILLNNIDKYNNSIINNIIFRLLFLLTIRIITSYDIQIAILLGLIYIRMEQISIQNKIRLNISEFEYSKQLDHFTQDYIIQNNIN